MTQKEKSKKYYEEHKEEILAKQKKYYYENKEKMKEKPEKKNRLKLRLSLIILLSR